MKNMIRLIAIFLMVVISLGVYFGCGISYNYMEIDKYLLDVGFWGTILVMHEDNIVHLRAYGKADAEHNIKNTINTPFYLCSLTKQFTGAAILVLEAEGKLNDSDTLDRFFPEYDKCKSIMISDLLTMMAGTGDFLSELQSNWLSKPNFYAPIIESIISEQSYIIAKYDGDPIGLEEALINYDYEDAIYKRISVEMTESLILSEWDGNKSPVFTYSNSDYFLLGRIIEIVSGKTYQEYITEKLLIPAGMTNTGFAESHGAAVPHNDTIEHLSKGKYQFVFLYSAGNMISNVDDLSLWLDAYFGGKLFPISMLEKVNGYYNYGWHVTNDKRVYHHGEMKGVRTYIMYDIGNKTKVIILSNKLYNDELPNVIISLLSQVE